MEKLSRQFLSGCPVGRIALPVNCADLQQEIVDATVNHQQNVNYPVSAAYAITFLKVLMSKVEERGEVLDCVYESFGSALSQPKHADAFSSYFIKDSFIAVQESPQLISDGTTGLQTWQASRYLAEWSMSNCEYFKNKNVIELGSGVGLLGLVVIKHCACQSYFFTDHHNTVLQMLKKNLSLNTDTSRLPARTVSSNAVPAERVHAGGIEPNISTEHPLEEIWTSDNSRTLFELHLFSNTPCVTRVSGLDWEEWSQQRCRSADAFSGADIILAADVVYDTRLIPALASTIRILLSEGAEGCRALIASTIRNPDTHLTFLKELASQGLEISNRFVGPKQQFDYDDVDMVIIEVRPTTKLAT